MNELQKYTVEISHITKEIQDYSPNCNTFFFVNKSKTTTVLIDEFPLEYNEMFDIDGNRDEICVKVFRIKGNSDGQLYCFKKLYVK